MTIREDGTRGLAKGWAPTFYGYSMQVCEYVAVFTKVLYSVKVQLYTHSFGTYHWPSCVFFDSGTDRINTDVLSSRYDCQAKIYSLFHHVPHTL